jgi:cation diffusion facilitator family transporter
MVDAADTLRSARRLALISVIASGLLALGNIVFGLRGGSTSTVAAGLEFAGDVLASAIVYFGMLAAARPPDANHPYGHGRVEIVAGVAVGMILLVGGAGICFRSLQRVGEAHPAPAAYTLWPLAVAAAVKAALSIVKYRFGRRVRSASLVADAWNDGVDVLSASVAAGALALTLHDPARFLAADHYGGCAVGVVVIFTGIRVIRDSTFELMDTMPSAELIGQIRRAAQDTPGVVAVEKCFARKTGLQYHVDIHLEVDPGITVARGHEIATEARVRICRQIPAVADVLVHIEPAPTVR